MPVLGSATPDLHLPSLRPLRRVGDGQKEVGERGSNEVWGWGVEGGDRDGIWGEKGGRGQVERKGPPQSGEQGETPENPVPLRKSIQHSGVTKSL